MSTPPLDLEPIRAREAATTPGPWRSGRNAGVRMVVSHDIPFKGPASVEAPFRRPRQMRIEFVWSSNEHDDADAEFVAHAREDVPALILEVDRLTAALAVAEAALATAERRAWDAEDSYLRRP